MTADHSPTPEELMAYLDGELPGEPARGVVAHLATCERCQRLAGDLRDLSRDARTWQVGEAPDSLRLPSAVPARKPGLRAHMRHVGGTRSFAAAAVVIVAVAALWTWRARLGEQPGRAISAIAVDRLAEPAPVPPPRSSRLIGGAGQVPAQTTERVSFTARTITLRLLAADFDGVRPAIDRTLRDLGGFVGHLGASDSGNAPPSIQATLHVPAARLDEAVAAFKALGRVLNESQNSEDVTEQVVDLDVRIANARITEQRLIELLQTRTGRVSDVLEAEREIARVRTELERLDAQRKNVQRRVDYAIVVLEVTEDARASVTFGPQPVPGRVRNAVADGFSFALASLLGAVLFVLRIGPSAVLWGTLVGVPAWLLVRRRDVASR